MDQLLYNVRSETNTYQYLINLLECLNGKSKNSGDLYFLV